MCEHGIELSVVDGVRAWRCVQCKRVKRAGDYYYPLGSCWIARCWCCGFA